MKKDLTVTTVASRPSPRSLRHSINVRRPRPSFLPGALNQTSDRIGELILHYRSAKALFVATELDLFRCVEETDGRLESIARRAKVAVRQLEILMDALVSLEFLRKNRRGYRNTPYTRGRLLPGRPRSIASNLRYQELLSEAYSGMAETIRRGRPRLGLKDLLARRPAFVRDYIQGMSDIAQRPAAELAQALDLNGVQRMLDVGGGPGTFTLACLRKNPRIEATILDLPETLAHTKRFVAASPWKRQIKLKEGNYHVADFGQGLDLILMSHITHDEGPEQNLAMIRKAHRALRNGGILVVHDFMLNSDKTQPIFGALFSVHLLSYTNCGRTYSERDYKVWVQKAHFKTYRTISICEGMPTTTMVLISKK